MSFFWTFGKGVFDWFYGLASYPMGGAWGFYGDTVLPIVFVTIIFIVWGVEYVRRGNGAEFARRLSGAVVAGALAYGVAELLKFLFKVPRPPYIYDIASTVSLGEYSFPSSHSAVMFAIFAWVAMCSGSSRGLAVFAGFLSLFVALSRMVAGAHYFFDVLVGIVVGLLVGLLVGVVSARYGFCLRSKKHRK